MIILIGAILGAVFGIIKARRRKGNLADIAQYAFIYAMMFALIALFITIIFFRML